MAVTIKMMQSAVAGKVPTSAQLPLGVLAINTNDGKLFLKKKVGTTETIVDVTDRPTLAEYNALLARVVALENIIANGVVGWSGKLALPAS